MPQERQPCLSACLSGVSESSIGTKRRSYARQRHNRRSTAAFNGSQPIPTPSDECAMYYDI